MVPFIVLQTSLSPIAWLGEILRIINSFTGNWGIAIIIFTILVKLLLHPLNKKQMESMKAMQDLQPDVEKLKKKYKDNPQELQLKTMELYKEKGVNPTAGCLPLLIQMPILYILFQSIRALEPELATAKFLWLDSLTKTGDIALILLNGLVMFAQSYLQQKMTSGDAAKQTAMMTYMMPIMIILISRGLPAGLLLYWFTSTLIMAVQQYMRLMKPAVKEVED